MAEWADGAALKCFWALVFLSSFDLLSTWLGVCRMGGIELNPVAIYIVQSTGYAIFGAVFLGIYIFGAALAYRAVLKARTGNLKLVFLAVTIIAVGVYSWSMFSNFEQLVTMAAGVQVETRIVADGTVPMERVYAAMDAFDRSRFCSVWGPFA